MAPYPISNDHDHDDDHDDFGGLQRDLKAYGRSMNRRQLMRVAASFGMSLGALKLLGCDNSPTTDDGTTGGSCSRIPEETAGPYPGDGSQGTSQPNVLDDTGVVRSDIRSSFGSSTTTATGVPLVITLNLVSSSTCAALSGYAVYLWHCDAQGRYSLYSSGVMGENYLRGVSATDSSGNVTFTTIFPGCYSGRWPHMHFEVYRSLSAATSVSNKIATSQLGFAKAVCDTVYAQSAYSGSATNLAQISYASDGIFQGNAGQVATTSGSVSAGYTASITIGVSV